MTRYWLVLDGGGRNLNNIKILGDQRNHARGNYTYYNSRVLKRDAHSTGLEGRSVLFPDEEHSCEQEGNESTRRGTT